MGDARAGGERCGLFGFAVTLPPAAIPARRRRSDHHRHHDHTAKKCDCRRPV